MLLSFHLFYKIAVKVTERIRIELWKCLEHLREKWYINIYYCILQLKYPKVHKCACQLINSDSILDSGKSRKVSEGSKAFPALVLRQGSETNPNYGPRKVGVRVS